ncbi:MAG: hypothetical protein II060_08655 [Bacteroidales bacterium]|nr:hypothetical protein [Bacteroidales bacterium]
MTDFFVYCSHPELFQSHHEPVEGSMMRYCYPLKILQIRAKITWSWNYMGLYLEKLNNLGEVTYL